MPLTLPTSTLRKENLSSECPWPNHEAQNKLLISVNQKKTRSVWARNSAIKTRWRNLDRRKVRSLSALKPLSSAPLKAK